MNPQYYQVGPGFGAFVVTFALAMVIWMLYRSFSKKLRKQKLEQRRLDELAAQEAAAKSGKTIGKRPASGRVEDRDGGGDVVAGESGDR